MTKLPKFANEKGQQGSLRASAEMVPPYFSCPTTFWEQHTATIDSLSCSQFHDDYLSHGLFQMFLGFSCLPRFYKWVGIFTTTELLSFYCISVADTNLDKVTNFHSSRFHQCANYYSLFYFSILTVYSEKKLLQSIWVVI